MRGLNLSRSDLLLQQNITFLFCWKVFPFHKISLVISQLWAWWVHFSKHRFILHLLLSPGGCNGQMVRWSHSVDWSPNLPALCCKRHYFEVLKISVSLHPRMDCPIIEPWWTFCNWISPCCSNLYYNCI